jgi:SAM-dependent methyltransferase
MQEKLGDLSLRPQRESHMVPANPYDELPYRCLPVEYSAPEKLSVASMLRGGPRMPVGPYRVLELGCGNGANLIPMAFYRPHAQFVGIDGSRRHIREAVRRQERLQLPNLAFLECSFEAAGQCMQGQFDFVLAHGIFSWVSEAARTALFRLCSRHLGSGGLLYLNYNTYPGWSVRGLVRQILLKHTSGQESLRERTRHAQALAADLIGSIPSEAIAGGHPYVQLIARELAFVGEHDPSYVAHEYLADYNVAFWRSEFVSLATSHGFAYVADADFNYVSGRTPEHGEAVSIFDTGQAIQADMLDLLAYRQLHSPIFTPLPWTPEALKPEEFERLFIASPLQPLDEGAATAAKFIHPSGY